MSLIRVPKNILHDVDNLSSRTGCPPNQSFLILCSSLAFPYCWATLHKAIVDSEQHFALLVWTKMLVVDMNFWQVCPVCVRKKKDMAFNCGHQV